MKQIIRISEKGEGFSAMIDGRPELSGYGQSQDEAVGNLISQHWTYFQEHLEVIWV